MLNFPPYTYAEDSALLGRFLSSIKQPGDLLEIGVGNGGNLSLALQNGRFKNITGTDILHLTSVRHDLPRSIELIKADAATCFRPESFDIVAFNPPYVPSEEIIDPATDGGKGGVEIPLRFLSGALNVLRDDGIVVMILSSEDSLDALEHYCQNKNLEIKKVGQTPLFFETLVLFVINRRK